MKHYRDDLSMAQSRERERERMSVFDRFGNDVGQKD